MLSAGRLPRLRGGTGREISSLYIDKPGILTPIFHSISGVHVNIVQQLLPVPFRSVPFRSILFQVLYLPVVFYYKSATASSQTTMCASPSDTEVNHIEVLVIN